MIYPFLCNRCLHDMDITCRVAERDDTVICPVCEYVMERQLTAVPFTTGYQKSFGSENNGKGRYFSNLAERQPYGRKDPKAFFADQSTAESAAKRRADKLGLTFESAK